MKLTINFETLKDLLAFIAEQTPKAQSLMGGAGLPSSPMTPATVTAGKQDVARQSTGLVTFETSGIADLVVEALKVNVDATKGVLIAYGGVIKGKPNAAGLKPEVFEKVRAELQAIIDGVPVVAAVASETVGSAIGGEPELTYAESGIKEKIQALQTREGMKEKLLALIKEFAPADAEGKHKASNIPAKDFKEVNKRLDALAAE